MWFKKRSHSNSNTIITPSVKAIAIATVAVLSATVSTVMAIPAPQQQQQQTASPAESSESSSSRQMMPSEMPFAEVFFSIDVEASVMPSEDPNAAPPNAGSGLAGLFLPPLTPEQHAILDPAFNALRAIQNLNVTDPQTYQRVLDQLPNLYTSVQGIMGTPNADIIARGIVYEALFALYNIENRSAPLVGSNELNDNFSALSDVPVSSSESSESSELSESASSSA